MCLLQALRARAKEEGLEVAIVSAKVESELMELPKEEAQVNAHPVDAVLIISSAVFSLQPHAY